jgi:hypothetical protein
MKRMNEIPYNSLKRRLQNGNNVRRRENENNRG